MTTCTFIGHRFPFDLDLQERLSGAITFLLRTDDSFEFLLRKNTICDEALPLLVRAKKCTNKNICLTLVDSEDRDSLIGTFDKVTVVLTKTNDPTYDKWAIDQSDVLISYVYASVYGRERRLLYSAFERKELKILDITSEETKKAILSGIDRLPLKCRKVVEGIDAGKTSIELSQELGITRGTVNTYNSWSRRKLGIIRQSDIAELSRNLQK